MGPSVAVDADPTGANRRIVPVMLERVDVSKVRASAFVP
jgi:hypothetical protein